MEIKLENESLELTINSFGAELKSITGKETGTPVSYTHLDVYKRQGWSRLLF